jgi:hypothetical protein
MQKNWFCKPSTTTKVPARISSTLILGETRINKPSVSEPLLINPILVVSEVLCFNFSPLILAKKYFLKALFQSIFLVSELKS